MRKQNVFIQSSNNQSLRRSPTDRRSTRTNRSTLREVSAGARHDGLWSERFCECKFSYIENLMDSAFLSGFLEEGAEGEGSGASLVEAEFKESFLSYLNEEEPTGTTQNGGSKATGTGVNKKLSGGGGSARYIPFMTATPASIFVRRVTTAST